MDRGKVILNGVLYTGGGGGGGTTSDIVHFDTTAHWNAQTTLIGQSGHIYVYTDYSKDNDNNDVPGIKLGTGSYLIDEPFVDGNREELLDHIGNTVIHVTQAEKDAWDEKVRCFMSQSNNELLVFTTAPSSAT